MNSKPRGRIIEQLNGGTIFEAKSESQFFFVEETGFESQPLSSLNETREEYYLKQASDYLGLDIRNNSRHEKIRIGMMIDTGTWDSND